MNLRSSLPALLMTLLTASACSPRASLPPLPPAPMSAEAQSIYRLLLADRLVQDGQPEKAMEVLRELIDSQPAEELYLEFATLAWRLNRFPEALNALAEAVQRYPQSRNVRMAQARALATRGRHEDAALTLSEYLALHPDDVEVRTQAAAHFLDAAQPRKAIEILAPIPRDKRDARYYFLQGKALIRQGQISKGIVQLEEAAGLNPDAEEIWIEMALAYERQGNLQEAERILSELVRLGKGGDPLVMHLLELNVRLKNPDKGLAVFLETMPSQETILDGVHFLIDQELFDHAATLLESIISQGEPSPEVRLTWGFLEAKRRNHAHALEILAPIPEDGPLGVRTVSLRLLILQDMGKVDEAEAQARDAVRRFPQEPSLRVILANILEDAQNVQEAEEVLRRGLEQAPDSPQLLYRLGMLLDESGRKAEAMEVMERLIATHSDHADALNYVGYSLAEEGRDLERAEKLIRSALAQEPTNGYFLDSLAWVLFRQGRLKLAWTEIQRAVAVVDDPIIWEHYGDIAAALGLYPQARHGYTQALRLQSKNAKAIHAKLRALGGGPR
ncbi:MAG: tetratricopeptide repeat protein [Desulfomicrobiaceae bacterium]